MSSAKYIIRVGETLNLQLTKVPGSTGNLANIASVSALLKKAQGNTIAFPGAPTIATFVITNITDGWNFSVPSSVTAGVTPGLYFMDARLVLINGNRIITDPIGIEVRSSVSG